MIVAVSILNGVLILFLVLAILYLVIGWNRWLFHNLLGWHKPTKKKTFNGIAIISKCRYCGKEIAQDSQGNWFEVE